MELYNSLTQKIEPFESAKLPFVSMYSCGPTVYSFPSIGNYRTYALSDMLVRALTFDGYKVKNVMNLTDVGHLASDADDGEDKLEKQAEKEGRGAKEIADFYIKDFISGLAKLNINQPAKFTRATEYIEDQIELIKTLENKGYSYQTDDGIYFDTSKFPKYGELSGLTAETILEGVRVEKNPQKRNASDFALWKFSPKDKKRWQEWESPWGLGFPGWHIECSAMAMKELGETIDIHVGAEDLKMIHHQNEIAQSECATGKKFVRYWIHGAFLLVDGGRMGKSLGNAYTIADLEAQGFDPLALRYFYTAAHYRSPLNFTFEALKNAQNSLKKLYEIIESYRFDKEVNYSEKFITRFTEKLHDDLNMPGAVSVMWDMLKSSISESQKLVTILKMDDVLGFDIDAHIGFVVPQDILDQARTRQAYRSSGIWDKADMIRRELLAKGYLVEDNPDGTYRVKRKISAV